MLIYTPHDLLAPHRANEGDAGLDLKSAEAYICMPNQVTKIHTGVKVEIPHGFVGMVFPRSSLGVKKNLVLANTVGIIDSGYRGEIIVFIRNTGLYQESIDRYERFAQLVIVPCWLGEVFYTNNEDLLTKTERGEGGFGSSGKH